MSGNSATSDDNAMRDREASILALGRYRIVGEIGQGAMGTVYKALDPLIDRTVAIKTINLNLSRAEREEYQARFRQEIKAAGRLNHPNIVVLYDVGSIDQVAYMAMEFLDGRELKAFATSGRLVAVERTVEIIAQVADGLSYAHSQGVVHRDVKPSNIMVLYSGVVKITDFGIARLPNAAVRTATGMILGSPRYMSPEQATGQDLDARSDIFSLGVVLYEALTGLVPFDGANANAAMHAIMHSTPVPASVRNPAVPAMLDFILAKALAKAVDDRYQTIREFGDDLRDLRWRLGNASARPPLLIEAPPRLDGRLDPAALGRDDQPLALDHTFDSFDATVRLARITNQTAEFGEYISTTQKLRAYKASDQPTTNLPALATEAPAPSAPAMSSSALPLLAIAVLSIVALLLAFALVR